MTDGRSHQAFGKETLLYPTLKKPVNTKVRWTQRLNCLVVSSESWNGTSGPVQIIQGFASTPPFRANPPESKNFCLYIPFWATEETCTRQSRTSRLAGHKSKSPPPNKHGNSHFIGAVPKNPGPILVPLNIGCRKIIHNRKGPGILRNYPRDPHCEFHVGLGEGKFCWHRALLE